MNSALKNYIDNTGKKVVGGLVNHLKGKYGEDKVDGMAAYHKHKIPDDFWERKTKTEAILNKISELSPDLKGKLLFKTTEELEVILNELKCQNSKN